MYVSNISNFFLLFISAVALSVIDTSDKSFLRENWTQFPQTVFSSSSSGGSSRLVFPRDEHAHESNPSVSSSVTVNKVLQEKEPRSLWGPKWLANLTDAIGISNSVIRSQTQRKPFSPLIFSLVMGLGSKSRLRYDFGLIPSCH